jgi:hypothetical protein
MSLRDTSPYLKGKLAKLGAELHALTSSQIKRGLSKKEKQRLDEIRAMIEEERDGKS